ncbi:MAG: hypothetical protein MJ116_13650 [Lachnospiraceae bacterium]|nr:hypothetical protein [Lachnospiraceae bacterium]
MDVKSEIIQILDYLCDFETDEQVLTSYNLRDDLRLTDEELDSVRESIYEAFDLELTSEDMNSLDTIYDLIDLVCKRLDR